MNDTPGWVFSTPGKDEKERKKRYEPGNIATGLAVGTKSIIKGVMSGLAGVVMEPIKGAKHEGFKGATLGLGRGILGLVCKPVAGTLELVSYSVRGVNNMPTSLYRRVLLYFRRRNARLAKKKADDEKFANLQDLAPGSLQEVDLMPALSKDPLNQENCNEDLIDLSKLRISEIETANLVISPKLMLQTLVERNQKLYSLYMHISNRIVENDSEFQLSDIEAPQVYTPISYKYEDPDDIKLETSKVKRAGEKLRVALLELASIYRDKVKAETSDGCIDKFHSEEMMSFLMLCGRDIGIDILDEDLHSIVSSVNSSFSGDFVRTLSSSVTKPKSKKSKKHKKRRRHYSIAEEIYEKVEIDCEIQEAEEIIDEEEIIIEEFIVEEPPLNPVLVRAAEWKPFPLKDDYRLPELSNDKGGIALTDKNVLGKLRDAGKEIIKTVGKKILKGDFNLTTVSFPIKCMQPRTVLHNSLRAFILNPLYVNRASIIENPIERIKLIVASTIGSFHTSSTFLKPLNPYLGETVYCTFEDGTQLYGEQTTHHPPVSHFYLVGPNNLYKMYGYLCYEAKASLNSLTLKNSGVKTIKFQDGSTIEFTTPDETFNNTFLGTMRHESLGEIWYRDKVHKLECIIKFGTKKGPSDYFEGCIIQDNKAIVSKCSGSYLGWLDFDNVRYWDIRCNTPFEPNFIPVLPSDSDARKDLHFLKNADILQAQNVKEEMEEMQRRDRRLRETFKF